MKKGVSRIVFKIGKFAIKIPNHSFNHEHFLLGCWANCSERNWYKCTNKIAEYKDKMAPSLFCSWFGLIQIQYWCNPIDRDLTDEELKYFDNIRNGEQKSENFGYYNNRMVCLDYAQ